MKSALFFFIASFFYAAVLSQPSDFLIIKKGQTTVKSYFAGSNIGFETDKGFYSGQINAIRKDSLFLTQFDVRQVMTTFGFYILDTVASYRIAFSYKDIIRIPIQKRRGFDLSSSGGSLFGGGVLITAFGLGTWVFTKSDSRYYASPTLVISAAALAGVGYLLLRSNSAKYTIGKKYRLEYIKVK